MFIGFQVAVRSTDVDPGREQVSAIACVVWRGNQPPILHHDHSNCAGFPPWPSMAANSSSHCAHTVRLGEFDMITIFVSAPKCPRQCRMPLVVHAGYSLAIAQFVFN